MGEGGDDGSMRWYNVSDPSWSSWLDFLLVPRRPTLEEEATGLRMGAGDEDETCVRNEAAEDDAVFAGAVDRTGDSGSGMTPGRPIVENVRM